jgi:ferredoxin-like protein FixX
MEGPTSSSGLRNRITRLNLHEHHDDDDDDDDSTVKHNSCIFHCCAKMFSQKQHFSTQLRGHHQASILIKIKMVVLIL